jgi:methionyl-tRNA formyltransferase
MSRTSGRLVFVGAVHEAEPALRAVLDGPAEVAAVVTTTEETTRRHSGHVDLAPLARAGGVPVIRTDDVNRAGTVEAIRALAPDLLVVIGWSRLIRDELLEVPPRGCVGCHASLLPRHRGRAPVNWAMIRGETLVGNTMMLLAPGADTGDIVDQRAIGVDPEDTCATVYAKVGDAGADMLRQHLPALLAGTAPRRRQRADEGDLLPKRTPAMGITDWTRTARAIHDWIRAQTLPYPGAFTCLDGRKVMLWRSLVPTQRQTSGSTRPGEVLGGGADGVRIGTGTGPIVVTQMSWPGQPPEPAWHWCERARIRPGAVFDAVDRATAHWALGLGPEPVHGEVIA